MSNSLKTLLGGSALILSSTLNIAFASAHQAGSLKTIESSRPPYVAKVDSGRLISIALPPRQLPLDMNAANSIRSETGDFKPARYSFPAAEVPQSTLSRLTDLYRYDRRRDVPIVSSGGDWVIAEYFKAGSHVPVSRFQLLGKEVQRQEQLDVRGKVTKVVLVGWAPASSTNDDETTDPSALGAHPAWIRVFRVSPTGERTLVAIAWRKTPFVAAPETYDIPKDDELAFGLPNGVVKWRTKTAFLTAEHIDLSAASLAGHAASDAGKRVTR